MDDDDRLKLSELLFIAGVGVCVSCVSARTAITPERIESLIEGWIVGGLVSESDGPCVYCGNQARLLVIHYPLP